MTTRLGLSAPKRTASASDVRTVRLADRREHQTSVRLGSIQPGRGKWQL